jgi:hypothetical protein
MNPIKVSRFQEIGPERTDEFVARGYQRKHFFPHYCYYLPKCGPDGFKLAQRMCGPCRLDQLWELAVYAHPARLGEFPAELFFDDDLVWHQQQFGRTGLVATADLVVKDARLYSLAPHSDLVQRAARQPAYRTRIQKVFKGWDFMVLNGLLSFALEHHISEVYIPGVDLALRNTDPARTVGRALFERVYDRHIHHLFRVRQAGEWWAIDVQENRDRVVFPETREETLPSEKTICLCHDVERGFGHRETDAAFATRADETSTQSLDEMLRIEEALGVKATYNVLGLFLPEVRAKIESKGHCLAFHSYDHQNLDRSSQLPRCRQVDYRIKGYRPPQSKITVELSDENLCFHNFEWLANSAYAMQRNSPEFSNRLVKIPITFDEFDLYRGTLVYEAWEAQALEAIKCNDFVAFSLHDCYAPLWLPHYNRFLEKVRALGRLKTLNEVMNEVVLSHAQ